MFFFKKITEGEENNETPGNSNNLVTLNNLTKNLAVSGVSSAAISAIASFFTLWFAPTYERNHAGRDFIINKYPLCGLYFTPYNEPDNILSVRCEPIINDCEEVCNEYSHLILRNTVKDFFEVGAISFGCFFTLLFVIGFAYLVIKSILNKVNETNEINEINEQTKLQFNA